MEQKEGKVIRGLMNVSSKDKITAIISLALLLSFACFYFGIIPLSASHKVAKINDINLGNQILELQEKQDKLKGLQVEIGNRKTYVEKIKDVLPEDPQVPELVVMLDKIAGVNQLYINNFLPKLIDEDKKPNEIAKLQYKRVEIQFDVVGSYPDMKQFIKDLEQNIRTIDIINISVSGGGESTNTGDTSLRFSIKGYAYYQ